MTARSLWTYNRAPGRGGHGAAAPHLFRLIVYIMVGTRADELKLNRSDRSEPEESGSGRPPACNIRDPLAHAATIRDLVVCAIVLVTCTPVGNNR